MVFHDATLRRLTGREGRLSDHSSADLRAMRLAGADETIPTLAEALTEIGRRAMVHIEIKIPYGEVGPLERRVHEVLIDHNGPTCIIGFNPYSHAWFAERHPKILRGLDSYSYKGPDAKHLAPDIRKRYAELGHVSIAKPHFLALSSDMLPSAKAEAFRRAGMPIVAWTIRDPTEWDRVRQSCDNLIFEGFAA
jgi:glycerophosphoryl diester phosphodiesterase